MLCVFLPVPGVSPCSCDSAGAGEWNRGLLLRRRGHKHVQGVEKHCLHGEGKRGDGSIFRNDKTISCGREGEIHLFFRGLQELLKLLSTDAVLGKSAPLDAGRADRPGVQMAALLAGGIRLIAPDLYFLAALLTPDVFRLWRPYLTASWTTFFKHGLSLHPWRT
jgi:hypothetical protein